MKKYIAPLAVLSLLAAGMLVVPVAAQAQDANTNASSNQAMTPQSKRHHVIPFRGRVGAVDANAMTLTVGKRTFQVTSDTKILKDGQPAALADGMAGKPVRGAYRKSDDGKLVALSVYFGAKSKAKSKTPDLNGN